METIMKARCSRIKWLRNVLAGGLLAVLGAGLLTGKDGLPLEPRAIARADDGPEKAGADQERQADKEAIRKLAQEFSKAFEQGDAKAIAALYTAQSEYYDDNSGEMFRGREGIERAFADLFRKRPKSKAVVQTLSIRFLGRDTALDEGLVHIQPPGSELPLSSRYSCLCVREDGQWKIALVREWGIAQDKLEDLHWLLGDWVAKSKDREVHISFRWNENKTMILNQFTIKEGGRVTFSGTQRIGLDPHTGQIRSWTSDENGGRGQAFWIRDGNSWLLEAIGLLADGTETSSVNILTRINNDHLTWRSVDRRIGGEELAPTDPIKVVRTKGATP
jgi:uncharacterized protein (TIGR02246 family)